jgi:hypothetical protein
MKDHHLTFKERIAAATKTLGKDKADALLEALVADNCGEDTTMKQRVRALEDAVKASNVAPPPTKPATNTAHPYRNMPAAN